MKEIMDRIAAIREMRENVVPRSQVDDDIDSLQQNLEALQNDLIGLSQKMEQSVGGITQALNGVAAEVQRPAIDMQALASMIAQFSLSVEDLQRDMIEYPRKAELQEVIEALQLPRKKTVTFEVETDNHDFPVKVIATEVTSEV